MKEFAQKMVEAHTGTTAKLKGIIASNNIKVTPPAHVDNRRQGMLDDLRGAKAEDFDHRYIVQQVAAHKEADILIQRLCQGRRQCRHQGLCRNNRQGREDAPVDGAEAGCRNQKRLEVKTPMELAGARLRPRPFGHHRRPS